MKIIIRPANGQLPDQKFAAEIIGAPLGKNGKNLNIHCGFSATADEAIIAAQNELEIRGVKMNLSA